MHRGKRVSVFERRDDDGVRLDDGQKIVYANGQWDREDDVGRLMADLKESSPAKMHYKVLSDRVQSIKEPMVTNLKEGNMSEGMYAVLSKYSDAWERKGRNEGLTQGLARTARAMLADNMDVRLVARYTSLPVEEIERMKAEPGT